ncbi:hypothetical protein K505DRAFT_101422 [Melanomma pulvis-pyrius CBS 109.77]|uniref:Uncharacterized protein n=1 Tax=Melanomma pulvis-pyrius CBS 109.77 TaxID=1314802 RepID=A0A6A6WXS9_9PLEO|nr:hypothetical protein K505DRAFT_101422 [Melanomma pulvis-pyrius CBS 109.77]
MALCFVVGAGCGCVGSIVGSGFLSCFFDCLLFFFYCGSRTRDDGTGFRDVRGAARLVSRGSWFMVHGWWHVYWCCCYIYVCTLCSRDFDCHTTHILQTPHQHVDPPFLLLVVPLLVFNTSSHAASCVFCARTFERAGKQQSSFMPGTNSCLEENMLCAQ